MGDKKRIYGIHAVKMALKQQPQNIIQLMVQQGRKDKRMNDILSEAGSYGLHPSSVEGYLLDQLSGGQKHQGIIAEVKAATEKSYSIMTLLDELEEAGTPPLLLVLDEVQDPHNVGAVLRSADAAGVHAVLATKNNSASITDVVRKVACGAAETVPFFQVQNLANTIEQLKQRGIWFVGTSDDASDSLHKANLTGSLAIVVGSEGKGMRRLTKDSCDSLIAIPMLGQVESLNVSVATGVVLYEALRQRQ